MPVLIAPINKNLKIVKILSDEKTKKHLESLGVSIDGDIQVISHAAGSVVLLVKNTRLALDSSIATKIFVREEA